MPPFLIATEFTYQMRDGALTRTERGSYLGRTRASVRTIRRFINGNEKRCGLGRRIATLTIGGSYTSRWIAK